MLHSTPTTPFRTMAPQSTYQTITEFDFGKTGYQTFTAPEDGWVCVYFSGSVPSDLFLANQSCGMEVSFVKRGNSAAYIPCSKGDTIAFYSSGVGNSYSWARFIPARVGVVVVLLLCFFFSKRKEDRADVK